MHTNGYEQGKEMCPRIDANGIESQLQILRLNSREIAGKNFVTIRRYLPRGCAG
jgi:hypothetical protein